MICLTRSTKAFRKCPNWLSSVRSTFNAYQLNSNSPTPSLVKALRYSFPRQYSAPFTTTTTTNNLDNADDKEDLSTVEIGTIYENKTIECLLDFGFQLRRVGGALDKGIDLRGNWNSYRSHPVIIQCKREAKPVGPKYIRELEGTLSHESPNVIGILVSQSGFTNEAKSDFNASKSSMILVGITDNAKCFEFHMNKWAQSLIPNVLIITKMMEHVKAESDTTVEAVGKFMTKTRLKKTREKERTIMLDNLTTHAVVIQFL